MQFHANYVSVSVEGDGDGYQAMFEAEYESEDMDSPYLLIQRQFEIDEPDDGRCYIETHDEKYVGHFHLRRVEFTPNQLWIELDRASDNLIHVTFSIENPEFEEASRAIKIMSGEIQPDDAGVQSEPLILTVTADIVDGQAGPESDIKSPQRITVRRIRATRGRRVLPAAPRGMTGNMPLVSRILRQHNAT